MHIYATLQYGKDYTRPAMQIIAPYLDSLVTHLGVNKALKIGKTWQNLKRNVFSMESSCIIFSLNFSQFLTNEDGRYVVEWKTNLAIGKAFTVQ